MTETIKIIYNLDELQKNGITLKTLVSDDDYQRLKEDNPTFISDFDKHFEDESEAIRGNRASPMSLVNTFTYISQYINSFKLLRDSNDNPTIIDCEALQTAANEIKQNISKECFVEYYKDEQKDPDSYIAFNDSASEYSDDEWMFKKQHAYQLNHQNHFSDKIIAKKESDFNNNQQHDQKNFISTLNVDDSQQKTRTKKEIIQELFKAILDCYKPDPSSTDHLSKTIAGIEAILKSQKINSNKASSLATDIYNTLHKCQDQNGNFTKESTESFKDDWDYFTQTVRYIAAYILKKCNYEIQESTWLKNYELKRSFNEISEVLPNK